MNIQGLNIGSNLNISPDELHEGQRLFVEIVSMDPSGKGIVNIKGNLLEAVLETLAQPGDKFWARVKEVGNQELVLAKEVNRQDTASQLFREEGILQNSGFSALSQDLVKAINVARKLDWKTLFASTSDTAQKNNVNIGEDALSQLNAKSAESLNQQTPSVQSEQVSTDSGANPLQGLSKQAPADLSAKLLQGLSEQVSTDSGANPLQGLSKQALADLSAKLLQGLSEQVSADSGANPLQGLSKQALADLSAKLLQGLSGQVATDSEANPLQSLSTQASTDLSAKLLQGLSEQVATDSEANPLQSLSTQASADLSARLFQQIPILNEGVLPEQDVYRFLEQKLLTIMPTWSELNGDTGSALIHDFLKQLGIGHERKLAELLLSKDVPPEYELTRLKDTIKAQILEALKGNGSSELDNSASSKLQGLLDKITGQQLFLSDLTNSYIWLSLPLKNNHNINEAKIALQGDRRKKTVEPSHCRIGIYLETPALGQIGVDAYLSGDALSLRVLTQQPQELSILLQELKAETVTRLAGLGLRLTGLDVVLLETNSEFKSFVSGEPRQGVDIYA